MSSINSSILIAPQFSVRIVVCDHYLTGPSPGVDVTYSEFRGSEIKQVPILRIFGSAADGHKACLHIHGVFPYFYVPCPTSNPQPQLLYQIAASLDKALNIALKQATSLNQHVYKITLVKGLPFYGFHDKEHLYLKIFLYNPGLIKQAVELCSNGAILGQTLQPHESHLNFTLQFFIDFNLFGMSNIDLQTLKFRKFGTSQRSDEPMNSPIESQLKPESVCYYEVDCMASHIINRLRVGRNDGIENPGLEEVWHQEMERRKHLNISMASKSLSQGRLKSEETESHYKFERMFWTKISNLINQPVATAHVFENKNQIYPAESQDGSELSKAGDISVHQPDNHVSVTYNNGTLYDADVTLIEDHDDTVVDESVALNSSLSIHYSQIALDSEDMDLLDMLKDMEVDKSAENDSVMGTPANVENELDNVSDDEEYSQIFNEETLVMEEVKCENASNDSMHSDDSIWNSANIPQLDGACDDEHTKNVKKQKLNTASVGLSLINNGIQAQSSNSSETAVNFQIKLEPEDNNLTHTQKECHTNPSIKIKTYPSDITNSDVKTDISDTLESSVIQPKCRRKMSTESKQNDCQIEFCNGLTKSQNVDQKILQECDNKFSVEKMQASIVTTGLVMEVDDDTNLNVASVLDNSHSSESNDNISVTDIVKKLSTTDSMQRSLIHNTKARSYELLGPSTLKDVDLVNISDSDALDLAPDDSYLEDSNKLGIVSFYNISKVFNTTTDNEMKFNVSTVNVKQESNEQDNNIRKRNTVVLTPTIRPPSKTDILSSLSKYNIPKVRHPKPYYSNCKDVRDKVEIGSMVLKLRSKVAQDQKPFINELETTTIEEWRQLFFLQNNETSEINNAKTLKTLLASNSRCILEPLKKPPNSLEVKKWLRTNRLNNDNEVKGVNKEIIKNLDELDNSQAIGLEDYVINSSISLESVDKDKPNLNESLQVTMQSDGSYLCFGNGGTPNQDLDTATVEVNFLTVMILEVQTSVRGDLFPDPLEDPIVAAFITITNDCPPGHFLSKSTTEITVIDNITKPKMFDRCVFNVPIEYVSSEIELIEKVKESVRKHDPDIMCGYEIEMSSWGYFIERAQVLGAEIILDLSRITEKHRQKRSRANDNSFEGKILGRVTFNVWRLFRYELALSSYSFENCMYEILKERTPEYTHAQLAEWWNDESRILRWIPIEYYLTKLSGTMRMLEKLDIINRTSELARLFGLQWWEVLSRGSQFRVESLMLRAARPLNLVALSPTVKQRAAMRAPECLPLIFEPESRFYCDPVIVLDFQSLYPSMMIAYNYCFSTSIGRVDNINGDSAYEFGAWKLKISKGKLETLVKNGLVHWSPVGVGFVKPEVRRGVLPALLRRILAARQAVKKSMKLQTDEALKKAMHSRQLGLKLIANVTYGYTAANFSGRMPCVEVGDSVVSKGRETLERAVRLVENNAQWNVKVVYGDTDSMFVLVPGGTREEAFRIGQEIADAVTADNPSPVALKLEKVYQPCILQTKKRYVGFMYETPDQEKPVYEAKGIETVRRDGCPAGVKLLRDSLCELFTSGDVSIICAKVTQLLLSLVRGTLPPQELFFTREYHGPDGYKPGAAAPPAHIADRLGRRDRRARPRPGERVAWLVCAGAPSEALLRLARAPAELLREPALRPHVAYYAARVLLPPLQRCLSLLGVDIFKWWRDVGYAGAGCGGSAPRAGITRYLRRGRCAGCGARGAGGAGACADCGRPSARIRLVARRAALLATAERCRQICSSCCGHPNSRECRNTECPALWRRRTADHDLLHLTDIFSQFPGELQDEYRFDF